MGSALDLINQSMMILGELEDGESVTATEEADALQTLNDFLDEFNVEGRAVFVSQSKTFNLVAGVKSYLIGPGSTFNAQRPVAIQSGYTSLNGVDQPLDIIGNDQYNAISLKSNPVSYPSKLVYDAGYPNGTITLWGVPSVAMTITLTYDTAFAPLATSADAITVPPGYKQLLKYELAEQLADVFGVTLSASAKRILEKTRKNVKRRNRQQLAMSFDSMLQTGRSFRSGWPYA